MRGSALPAPTPSPRRTATGERPSRRVGTCPQFTLLLARTVSGTTIYTPTLTELLGCVLAGPFVRREGTLFFPPLGHYYVTATARSTPKHVVPCRTHLALGLLHRLPPRFPSTHTLARHLLRSINTGTNSLASTYAADICYALSPQSNPDTHARARASSPVRSPFSFELSLSPLLIQRLSAPPSAHGTPRSAELVAAW